MVEILAGVEVWLIIFDLQYYTLSNQSQLVLHIDLSTYNQCCQVHTFSRETWAASIHSLQFGHIIF